MNSKLSKKTGKLILIIGCIALIGSLIILSYSIEYSLAFNNTSILHINLHDNFASLFNLILIGLFILLIISGAILSYGIDLLKIKKILIKFFISLLFILEVGLAYATTHLIILWIHLSEIANLGYSLAIILSIILIDILRDKLKKN